MTTERCRSRSSTAAATVVVVVVVVVSPRISPQAPTPRLVVIVVKLATDALDDVRRQVVLDGAKALSAAVREVFGAKALIQRCTLHKRGNIVEHLPD